MTRMTRLAGHPLTTLLPILLALAVAFAMVAPAGAADITQFRGPDRDGRYPDTGLLSAWPESGPMLKWSIDGLGESYATVTVADGHIFATGKFPKEGSEDKDASVGRAFAFDLTGKKLWTTEYGDEHSGSGYPGTRSTPTFDAGMLYLLSSNGEAVALDAATGEIRWKVDVLKKFGGENIYFGLSESPLIDGDRVILTPGGENASVVALDKKTGETVWQTKGLSDTSGYCSPRIMDTGKHRQIVTLVAKNLVGIDPASGEVLWRQPVEVSYDIHATSPLFLGDLIYITHGYNQGGKAFRLAADGRSVTPAWTEESLDVHHGGGVLVDGRIYGASSKKDWHVLDAKSGNVLASIKRLGKGSIVHADGLLYGYVENGDVVLVNPDPEKFEVISRFKVEKGEGHHWSHPVISDGILYIRHGGALLAYDIKNAG